MSAFFLTNKAKNDLKEIAAYTEKYWGREQRNIYLKQFDEIFHMLSKTPYAGKSCDYVKKGYRKVPQGSYIIFYRSGKDSSIEIVRILHKQMDVLPKISTL